MRALCCCLLLGTGAGFSFTTSCLHSVPSASCRLRRDSCRCAEGDSDDQKRPQEEDESLERRLNTFLDKPLIDPTRDGGSEEPNLLRQFKELVNSDYELAQTLYVGLVFAVLLAFAQQGVRIYKHCYFMPDKLCPWDVSVPIDFDF